jgi:hypothetical protein
MAERTQPVAMTKSSSRHSDWGWTSLGELATRIVGGIDPRRLVVDLGGEPTDEREEKATGPKVGTRR